MFRKSVYLDNTGRKIKSESVFYIVLGILLCISGLVMLTVPILKQSGVIVFVAGWIFLFDMLLSLLRPIFYNRGFTDAVMGLFTTLLYGLVSWSVSTPYAENIESYRLVLCIAIFFTGMSKILVFASLIETIALPLLLINGITDVVCSVLLLMGIPAGGTYFIYWYIGLLTIFSGFEYLSESLRIHKEAGLRV